MEFSEKDRGSRSAVRETITRPEPKELNDDMIIDDIDSPGI